jgi:D-serine deaminase-like pyridoxal phosphate-dependent protein
MTINDLDTPALVIDLDVMERNLARVADYAASANLRLRPHTKTHKSPALARRQLELGAAGISVAKTGEAEVMLSAEPKDLLVAYPIVGAQKIERLVRVAGKTSVTLALDSLAAAEPLGRAAEAGDVRFNVLVEVDIGLGRVGVQPKDAPDLAQAIRKIPGLDWRGIAFYPGHIKDGNDARLAELSQTVAGLVHDFRAAGLEPEIVSGGSTPLLFRSHDVAGLNEIRPGTYIFNDLNTIASGACALEDCAASVLATVVSTAIPGQMIIDGGSKTFSSDRLSSGEGGFGRLMEAPGAFFHRMMEEHGFVDLTKAERRFTVGDRVRVIPNHICVAVNLHEVCYGIRGGEVETCWKVEARGRLQ